ncbi:dipeptidase [Arenibaculum pallidiluteum]|uniref:dipeptidase n=1 Tax=Arenibaculum pallidiluteum TaxID=2812559 RepID=UPI001A974A4D|nr:dipeptidase [Arenibaculum pallidiluteum]
MTAFPIFDGHNDVLLRLLPKGGGAARAFVAGDGEGHLDLPRMRKGGFAGGLFAVFLPSPDFGHVDHLMRQATYDVPLPLPLDPAAARPVAEAMAAILFRIEREAAGAVRICRTAAEIRQSIRDGVLATVLHFEGAEAIDTSLDALEVWHAAGLRSLGLVWSRPTAFGHGVPFRYPSSPDTGDGLTEAGVRLVRACNEKRILVDLSHLNEKGFWDVARISDAPLVATHSNAHALSPHARNLTDDQLAAIRESRGMVGVNFATSFIRPDGRMDAATPLDQLLRHFDHLVEKVGIDGVGFGSDFDGATVPDEIQDVTGLPAVVEALRRHGWDEPSLRKLCWENWVSVLERTWGG